MAGGEPRGRQALADRRAARPRRGRATATTGTPPRWRSSPSSRSCRRRSPWGRRSASRSSSSARSARSEAENAVVDAVVRALMGPELTDTVIAPFVHAQLPQPSGGVALGGLLIAWWLSSHLFESTGHALDAAYGVEDGRTTSCGGCIALAFALGSVLLVAVSVELMVLGPLGDPQGGLSRRLGLGEVYSVVWCDRALAAAAGHRRDVPGLPLPLQPRACATAGARACPAPASARRCGSSPPSSSALTARSACAPSGVATEDPTVADHRPVGQRRRRDRPVGLPGERRDPARRRGQRAAARAPGGRTATAVVGFPFA